MASAPRPAIPAPQIFTSDPIEQTYAKGTLDPAMGGIAYAYLQAAHGDRADSQDVYMQSLRSAQDLQAQLQREDNQQDLLKEALKMAPEYAAKGISASEVPMINRLYKGGTGSSDSAALERAFLIAKANHENAAAAHAGDAGAPTYTEQNTITPTGIGDTVQTSKGKNFATVSKQAAAAAAAEAAARQPGGAKAKVPLATLAGDALDRGAAAHPNSGVR